MTKKTDAQIESQKCVPQNLDDSECEKRKEYNRLTYEDKAKTPQNGGEVVDCTEDDCNLGYYVFDHPEYTVRKINEIFSL